MDKSFLMRPIVKQKFEAIINATLDNHKEKLQLRFDEKIINIVEIIKSISELHDNSKKSLLKIFARVGNIDEKQLLDTYEIFTTKCELFNTFSIVSFTCGNITEHGIVINGNPDPDDYIKILPFSSIYEDALVDYSDVKNLEFDTINRENIEAVVLDYFYCLEKLSSLDDFICNLPYLD